MSFVTQFTRKMKYQVTDIEFDFTGCLETQGSYELPKEEQKEVYDEVIGSFWDADDGDDLVDEITSATGWCIKTIDYRHILK